MATNKPMGDNAGKGAVKKRSQTRTTMGGASTWTKRDTASGEFVAVKKAKKAAATRHDNFGFLRQDGDSVPSLLSDPGAE